MDVPRYFFHIEDGENFVDLYGTELPDLATARMEAVRFASSSLRDSADQLLSSFEWKMRVADGKDLTLFKLNFICP
jgi:hypothetical protein